MSALLLSPHNDDAVLFASFTLIRHQPRVITCFRSDVQEHRHRFGVTFVERELEDVDAMIALGLDHHMLEQWPFLDSEPVEALRALIREKFAGLPLGLHVFAPAWEEEGHDQHNLVAEEADLRWGGAANRVEGGSLTYYMTYTQGRVRSCGEPVPFENEWVPLKLRALACYESQLRLDSTAHHFWHGIHEFYLA